MDLHTGLSQGQSLPTMPPDFPAFEDSAPAPLLLELPLHQLRVRHAKSAGDMAEIAQLRTEIDLAAAIAADPHFVQHEKKETRWALPSRST